MTSADRQPASRTNCLFFALRKLHRSGGYLVIRKSRFGWLPHLAWTANIEGLKVEEFKPIEPFKGNWLQRLFPIHMLLFRGYIRQGTGEETGKGLGAPKRKLKERMGGDRRVNRPEED